LLSILKKKKKKDYKFISKLLIAVNYQGFFILHGPPKYKWPLGDFCTCESTYFWADGIVINSSNLALGLGLGPPGGKAFLSLKYFR